MIQFNQVYKSYGATEALVNVSLRIEAGEFVFLAGHSGAGKTTLLKLLAAIERPSVGVVSVNNQNVGALKPSAIPYLRRNLGLIFQDQKLLFDRNVFGNVILPLLVVGTHPRDAAKRARAALDKVGLRDRERASPAALSGGEQQRLAIARAIVNRPALLLADEPTANLDRAAALDVIQIFREFHQVGVTVVIATHDETLFQNLQPRRIELSHGKLVGQEETESAR